MRPFQKLELIFQWSFSSEHWAARVINRSLIWCSVTRAIPICPRRLDPVWKRPFNISLKRIV